MRSSAADRWGLEVTAEGSKPMLAPWDRVDGNYFSAACLRSSGPRYGRLNECCSAVKSCCSLHRDKATRGLAVSPASPAFGLGATGRPQRRPPAPSPAPQAHTTAAHARSQEQE